MATEPFHPRTGEDESLAALLKRLRFEGHISHGVKKELRPGERLVGSLARYAESCGQVATGAVASCRDAIGEHLQSLGIGLHPIKGGFGILERGRKWMLGCQTVIDGKNPAVGSQSQSSAEATVAVRTEKHPTPAVEINQCRGRSAQFFWTVFAHEDLAAAHRDLVVGCPAARRGWVELHISLHFAGLDRAHRLQRSASFLDHRAEKLKGGQELAAAHDLLWFPGEPEQEPAGGADEHGDKSLYESLHGR